MSCFILVPDLEESEEEVSRYHKRGAICSPDRITIAGMVAHQEGQIPEASHMQVPKAGHQQASVEPVAVVP